MPRFSKVKENVSSLLSSGEENETSDPGSDTTVWGTESSFIQVTVVPGVMTIISGLNVIFPMIIRSVTMGGSGALAARFPSSDMHPERKQAVMRRRTQRE